MKNKILLIKTGNSETFGESKSNKIISLGDILRVTVLLNFYNDKQVDWVTDPKAFPLLRGISKIDQLYTVDDAIALNYTTYSLVINLEKSDFFLTQKMSNTNCVGFVKKNGIIHLKFKGQAKTLKYSGIKLTTPYENILCQIIDKHWTGEPYLLGYKSKSIQKKAIGFNWKVGKKWPKKRLDKTFWGDLKLRLNEDGHVVSWQTGFNSLIEYIDWIQSCEVLVTLDSLGLHIAIALEKKVFAIFSNTFDHEINIKAPNKVFKLKNKNYEQIIQEIRKNLWL